MQLRGLSADDYLAELQGLLPPGDLTREPGAILTRLLLAIADALARADALATDLIEEADPRTTTLLLPDWERVAGLPDSCVDGADQTLQERRTWLVSRLTMQGGQSRAWFIALAASLDYAITIDEYHPSMAGLLRAGEQVAGMVAWTCWVVHMPAAPTYWFRSGGSTAGEALGHITASYIECLFKRYKPAHTTVFFSY
jgi:uncharacterized protein YmfQ (DUF2313 family)